jgi:hypothetical protein
LTRIDEDDDDNEDDDDDDNDRLATIIAELTEEAQYDCSEIADQIAEALAHRPHGNHRGSPARRRRHLGPDHRGSGSPIPPRKVQI